MEKGIKYKTSRISHVTNYFLIPLVAVFISFLTFLLTNSLLIEIATYACGIIIVFLLFEPEWDKIMKEYYITNEEVMEVDGIIRKKRIVIPYQSVADVKVMKGVLGRIFNFGDVAVAGMRENIKMKGMKNADEIYKIIENKIALMKRGGAKRIEEEKED